MRIRGAMLVLVAISVAAFSVAGRTARAAERESGIQRSPDRQRTLVSKDVEGQRYAITLNTEDRSLTGNVFFTDGGSAVFIACTRVSGNDFTCSIAGACTSEGRASGIQNVPGGGVLVSKDVGGQRYAITANVDGTLTGNVFFADTGAAKFIFCEPLAGDPPAFACAVADSCATASCVDEFVTLPDPVTLPSGFFAVPGACPSYQPVSGTIALPAGFFDPASARLDAKEQQVFGALQKTTQVTGVLAAGVQAVALPDAAAAASGPTACQDGGTVTTVADGIDVLRECRAGDTACSAFLQGCRVGDVRCTGVITAESGQFTPALQCVDVEQDQAFEMTGGLTFGATGPKGPSITGGVTGMQESSTAFACVYDGLTLDADARGGRAAGSVDVTGTFFPGAFEHVEMSFPGNDPATGESDPGFAKIVGLRSGGPGIIFVFVFDLNLDTGKLTPR